MKVTTHAALVCALSLGLGCSGNRSEEITRNRNTSRSDAATTLDAASADEAQAEPAQPDPGEQGDADLAPGSDAGSASDAAPTPDAAADTAVADASEVLDARASEDASSLDANARDSAFELDAGDAAADAGERIDAGNGEAPDGNVCGTSVSSGDGCADGLRRGLTSVVRHPDIAACKGVWEGDVSNAVTLCAPGFHVCTGAEPALRAVTYELATCFPGCFAFDAAQDNYQCLPDCSSRIGSTDTATLLDMGGMGMDCRYKFAGANSCLMGGRIDSSENDGIGCNYDPSFTGVICCRDGSIMPLP